MIPIGTTVVLLDEPAAGRFEVIAAVPPDRYRLAGLDGQGSRIAGWAAIEGGTPPIDGTERGWRPGDGGETMGVPQGVEDGGRPGLRPVELRADLSNLIDWIKANLSRGWNALRDALQRIANRLGLPLVAVIALAAGVFLLLIARR